MDALRRSAFPLCSTHHFKQPQMLFSTARTPVYVAALFLIVSLPACGSAMQAPDARAVPGPVNYTLRISSDGHKLVRSDGTPFIWIGDTAWELFHRLTREEADYYLADRARKGFNVIQAAVLAEIDGLGTPNALGETPLTHNDPTTPNEKYFEHVDYVVNAAQQLGMFVGMLPTWGDKWNKKWGVGPEIFTPENARVYGRFLGERYKDKPIIWILGGDRVPEDDRHVAIIRALAQGIEEGNGGTQLMTFHPMGGGQSSAFFHNDGWLDFNMFQSGHEAANIPNYEMTESDYNRSPAKPVLDGEHRYEDHPINWDPKNGWFDDWDVRQAAYWSMLSGAAGDTYGDHDIWQFWQAGREPVSRARTPWKRALGHAGASQMGYLRDLFESRPFLELRPDQSVLSGDTGHDASVIRASRSNAGHYLLAYSPTGSKVTVNLDKLSGEDASAWWFNPRTGEADAVGTFQSNDTRVFDPPGDEARGNDWVLVVDDVAQQYPKPGTPR